MKLEAAQLFNAIVQASVVGIAGYAVSILSKVKTSIEHLNIKIAIVIEKTAQHERELERHSNKIDRLEERVK